MFELKNSVRLGASLAVLTLAACNSSSSDTTAVVTQPPALVAPPVVPAAPTLAEALQISQLVSADQDRIMGDGGPVNTGIPGTVFEQVPTANTAFMRGPGEVTVFTRTVTATPAGTVTEDTAQLGMTGLARIAVDFADSTFTGSLDNMYAVDATTFATGLVGGSLTIAGTLPRTEDQPNALDGRAAGTVTAFGTSYILDINADGLLRGTNPSTDVKVRAFDLSGEGTVAGTASLAEITVVGDRYTGGGTGAYVNR